MHQKLFGGRALPGPAGGNFQRRPVAGLRRWRPQEGERARGMEWGNGSGGRMG